MTLSALSGNPFGGLVLGIAYVFGMVFPLLVMALLWDRFRLGERRFLQAKPVTIALPRGRALHTNTLNIGVAITFAIMGGFILYLADTGSMTSGPGFQVAIGSGLSVAFAQTQTWLAPVPEPILGLGLLLLAGVFVWATLRRRDTGPRSRTMPRSTPHPTTQPSGHCHEVHPQPATQEAEK